jgi:hypothetical protein
MDGFCAGAVPPPRANKSPKSNPKPRITLKIIDLLLMIILQ